MRLSPSLAVPLLAFLLVAGGCRGAAPGATRAPRVTRDPVYLMVTNRHPLDMKVYVLHGSEKTRIGIATALTTTSFRISAHLLRGLGDVRLYAEAIGSRGSVTSEMLVLHPGDAVDWSLAYDLDQSAVMVQ